MILYVECYTKLGYRMMKIDLSTEQTEQLDISRIRQMSESQISCLLTSGDIIAYAGKADQRQLFRINRIPTNYQDENRRYACVNLAFEGDDAESVNQIAAFALAEYPRFAIMVNQMIVYGETEAQIKIGVLKSWIDDAKQANLSFPPEKTIVVSGEGGEQAAQKLLNWVDPAQIEYRDLEKIRRETLPRPLQKGEKTTKLYLYFSAPETGYGFIRVNPESGEMMASGNEASIQLNPVLNKMVTNSGMITALFRGESGMNFIAKKICTEGQNQRMAVIVENDSGNLACAMAVRFMEDYPEFAKRVDSCAQIDEIQGTGSVDAQAFLSMLDWIQKAKVPNSGASSSKPYKLLVVDPTLDYFCQMMNIKIQSRMIEHLMTEKELQALREKPEKKVEMQMDAADVTTEKPTPTKDIPIQSENKKKEIKKPVEKKESPAKPSPSDQMTSGKKTAAAAEVETINLLDDKRFLPVTIGIGIALIILIGSLVHSSTQKKIRDTEAVSVSIPVVEQINEATAAEIGN